MKRKSQLAMAVAGTSVAATVIVAASLAATGGSGSSVAASAGRAAKEKEVHVKLTPSTPQLATCMPHAKVRVEVELVTDKTGRDVLKLRARGLPPRKDFTLFLLQFAAPPFGAAEYIGDFSSNRRGRAKQTLWLIVQEAFSSTIVNGSRVRVDLNQMGAWFADPKEDDFCLGPTSPVTPFDGDNSAGVQAFNSAQSSPLPAP
jgi:hypothetical protein